MWNWFGGPHGQGSKTAPVTLHVYDLGPAVAGVNAILGAVGTGAFHAGVEVYGQEWSFGCCCDGPYGSGIFCVPPKGCEAHVYREAVAMGNTTLSKRDVDDLIDRLAKEWHGSSYDLLRHNCCHFSDEFCKRLGVDPVPTWVLSLAGVGAMLRSYVRLGAGAVGGAAAAVYEGAAYAAGGGRRDDEEQVPGPGGRGGYPQEKPRGAQRLSPLSCQMPQGGRRATDGGGGLGPRFRAGFGQGLLEMRASLFDGAGGARGASASRAKAAEQRGADAAADSDRLVAGDEVEVFSNSHGAWCSGYVQSVDATGMALVTFRLPNAGPDELATKNLPLGHKHLRRAAKAEQKPLSTGDLVEIFSNSKQVWCPGYVESVSDRCMKVAFQLPGFAEGDLAHKELPLDHKDVRRAVLDKKAEAPTTRQVRRAKTDNFVAKAEKAEEADALAPPAATAAAKTGFGRRATVQGFEGEAEAGDNAASDETYSVGQWVEVFTNTHKVWCLGKVTTVDESGKVRVVFQMPGASTDEWVEKCLPKNCKDLRKTAVASVSELPGAAEPAWTSEERRERELQKQREQEEEAAYGERFQSLLASAPAGQADGSLLSDSALAEFLRTSGLPRRALKEIWQVANPSGKAMLGIAEFRVCCRLVAHCQTRSWDRAEILSEGGEALRRLCETELLQTPAPKLAEFKGQ